MGMTSSYGKEVTLTLGRECGEAELLKNVSICWCIYNIRVQWFYLLGPRWLQNVVLRHIYRKNYRFFQPFLKFKNAIWCKKTQNFMLISNPLKKLQNIPCKKVINKKVTEKWSFFTFITECLGFRPITFFGVTFRTFFIRTELSIKFCFLWYPYRIFEKINLIAYVSTVSPPPPPKPLVMDLARLKTITYRAI